MVNQGRDKSMPQRIFSLVCLLAIFVGPIIGAWWFLGSEYAKEILRNNHGLLIEPPINFRENNSLSTLRSISLRPGEWAVVYFSESGCNETCNETLNKLELVRSLLGRDGPRLHVWSILGAGPTPVKGNNLVDPKFPNDLQLILRDRLKTKVTSYIEEGLILLDWRSQVMMFYIDFEDAGLKHDLSRLLRASRIR